MRAHAPTLRRVSELDVVALTYVVGDAAVRGMWIGGDARTPFHAGAVADVLPRVDALRGELRDTMAIARGRTPELERFAAEWGRELLPARVLAQAPDILVVVPHDFLHGLPLHLVQTDAGTPLGSVCGITYASSSSLLVRCQTRNAARALDPSLWCFDERGDARPTGHYEPRSLAGVGADLLGGHDELFAAIPESLTRWFPDATVRGLDPRGGTYRGYVKAWMHRNGPSPDVLCIVAHGCLDIDDHRLSGLLLGGHEGLIAHRPLRLYEREGDFADLPLAYPPTTLQVSRDAEILTTAELEIDAHTNSQLALLLGCSAGWSRMLQSDEPASIAETVLRMGVPSVIAPLWDSDYATTRAWIDEFMDAWVRRGLPKALAAREALRSQSAVAGLERAGCLALRGDWL